MLKFFIFSLLISVALTVIVDSKKQKQFGEDRVSSVGADPADSWLAYTKAAGNGRKVTYVSANWIVPSYPTNYVGSNAPGFWFGIEPAPATDLIQPILAWADQGYQYTIFNGYYQWDNHEWLQSRSGIVKPGDHLFAYVNYVAKTNSYDSVIECKETGFKQVNNYAIETGKLYTDVYFVLEHQPDFCDSYPADGKVTFTNITIAWEGKVEQNPHWTENVKVPACHSKPHILSPKSVEFTWQT